MEEERPPFVQRVREQHPGKRVEVWWQDEARFGQKGTLTHKWAKRGSRPLQVRQTKYKSVHLYASVNPLTGESSCMVGTHVCTELMGLHLRWLSAQVGPDRHAVLVLDQAGWHVAHELEVPANITLHFLPAYSPELNPVERLWLWMRQHLLSNRVYHDEKDLATAGSAAFNALTTERVQSVCRVSWPVREK